MLSALPRRARIAVGIKGDGANAAPVAGRSGPALRMTLAGKLVYPSACLQLDLILTGMANGRGHEAQPAVQVLVVVPVHELRRPRPCNALRGASFSPRISCEALRLRTAAMSASPLPSQ